LDFHIASSHDRNCFGPIPDRHVDLEEMFQQTKFHRGNTSGTIGTPYADSQSTTETPSNTGDQQSGHQIKCVYTHSYQHSMKKLPEERESDIRSDIEATSTTTSTTSSNINDINGIRSDINDEF
jgi:hypothetical protein